MPSEHVTAVSSGSCANRKFPPNDNQDKTPKPERHFSLEWRIDAHISSYSYVEVLTPTALLVLESRSTLCYVSQVSWRQPRLRRQLQAVKGMKRAHRRNPCIPGAQTTALRLSSVVPLRSKEVAAQQHNDRPHHTSDDKLSPRFV